MYSIMMELYRNRLCLSVYFWVMKKTIALASACITSLMFGLEISSVPVILPTLGHVLGGKL